MKFPDLLPSRFQPQTKLYRSRYPNQPMLLYKGIAVILQGEYVVKGTTTVLLVWFPHPHAKFEFTQIDQLVF